MPEPIPEPQLFDEQSYELLRLLARYIVRNGAIEDEIVQETCLKLEAKFRQQCKDHGNSPSYASRLRQEWLTRAFLRVVLYNTLMDYYRRIRPIGPDPYPDQEKAGRPPVCVIELRLELLLVDVSRKPHEVLVYAYNQLLEDWKPKVIVSKLSHVPLADVAKRFVDEYADTSRLPRERLRELFAPLLGLDGPPLSKYWDAIQTITDYIEESRADVGDREHFSKDCFQAALERSAAKCIVYLLHEWLHWSPEDIREKGQETIGTLAEVLVDLVEELGGLDCGAAAAIPLSTFWDVAFASQCSTWILSQKRRICTRLLLQEERGLKTIFACRQESWKLLCFIRAFILRTPVAEFTRANLNRTLDALLASVEEDYPQNWRPFHRQQNPKDYMRSSPRSRPREVLCAPIEETVRRWFAPLRTAIEKQAIGSRTLREEVGAAGERAAEVLAGARTEILKDIEGRFGCENKETAWFAWRIGLRW